MSLTNWLYELRLVDVFHNDDLPFVERRDEIVARIKRLGCWSEDDATLVAVVHDLAGAEDDDEMDEYWDQFYDWADWNSVWVVTR